MCRDRSGARAVGVNTPTVSRGLVTADRRVTNPFGSLVKIAHGLVGRQVAGVSAYPLDLAEWSFIGSGATAQSWGGGAQGPTDWIEFIPPDFVKIYPAYFDTPGVLNEPLIYAIISHADPAVGVDASLQVGNISMGDGDVDPDTGHFVFGRYRLDEDITVDSDRLFMGEMLNNTTPLGNQRLLSPLKRDTDEWAWMMFHAKADGSYAMFDGFAAQQDNSIFSRNPGHPRTQGKVGLNVLGSSSGVVKPTVKCNSFIVAADRFLTVLDASPGDTADILDANGNVLASGVEAGGEISVDMMVLGDQTWNPNPVTGLPDNPRPGEAVTLRVTKATGDEISITPTGAVLGCWGGDVYSLQACT